MVFSQHTLADESHQKAAFNIDKQALSKGLDNFAKQSGAELLFISEVVHNKSNKALSGVYDHSTALSQMLEGTGLTFEKTPDNVYLIKKKPVASQYGYQQYLKARNNNIAMVSDNSGYKGTGLEDSKSFDAEEQQGSSNNDDDDDEDGGNTVVVIGSALITDPAQLTRQTLTVTREEILETGATRLADYLLTLPENLNAPSTVAAGDLEQAARFGAAQNEFGDTGINLRGLGEEYTLVLIDGERPVRAGFFGDAFDISTIPLAQIERIEILFDNAVAIYGPDALGGVLNIITRKDYDEIDFSLSVSVTDEAGGERYDASIGTSFNLGSTRFTVDASIETQKRIDGDARDVDFVGSPGSLPTHPLTGEFIDPGTTQRGNLISNGASRPLFYARDVDGDGRTDNQALNERLPAVYYEIDRRLVEGGFVNQDEADVLSRLDNFDPVNGVRGISSEGEYRSFLANQALPEDERDADPNINPRGFPIMGNNFLRVASAFDRRQIANAASVPNFIAATQSYVGYFPVYAVGMPEEIANRLRLSMYDFEEDLSVDLPADTLDFSDADDLVEINRIMAARFPTIANAYNPQAGISLAPETTNVSAGIRFSVPIADLFNINVAYRHSLREQRVEFSNSLRQYPLGRRNRLGLDQRSLFFDEATLLFNDDGFLPTERLTDVRTDNLRLNSGFGFAKDGRVSISINYSKRDSEAFRINEINTGAFAANSSRDAPIIGRSTTPVAVLDANGDPITVDENGDPLVNRRGRTIALVDFPGIAETDIVWWLPGLSLNGDSTYADSLRLPSTFSFADGENTRYNLRVSGTLFKLPYGNVSSSFSFSTGTSKSQSFTTTPIRSLIDLSNSNSIVRNADGEEVEIITSVGRGRDIDSFSTELAAPIYKNLLFSFAANGTRSSDISSPSPAFQFGLSWRPFDWFRATWNRSVGDRLPAPAFVGATIFITDQSGSNGYNLVPFPGAEVANRRDYYELRGGIDDIKPERNLNDNFGLNFDLKDYGLRFNVNYSRNKTKDLITLRATGREGIFDPQFVTPELEQLYNDPVFQSQTGGIFSNVTADGTVTVGDVVIDGFIENGDIAGALEPGRLVVDNRFKNAGTREVDNLGIGMSKVFEFERAGRLNINVRYNRVLDDRTILSNQCPESLDGFCGEDVATEGVPNLIFGTFLPTRTDGIASNGGRERLVLPSGGVTRSLSSVDLRFVSPTGLNVSRSINPIPIDSASIGIGWNIAGFNLTTSTSFRSDTSQVSYDEAPRFGFNLQGDYRTGGQGAGVNETNAVLRNTIETTTKAARTVNLNVNYRFGSGVKFLDWMGKEGSISLSINGLIERPTKIINRVVRREWTIDPVDALTLGRGDVENLRTENFSVFNFNPRERTYDIRYQTNF